MSHRDLDLHEDDQAVLDLFTRCQGIPMPETLETRVRRAVTDDHPASTAPDRLATLLDAYSDDAWSFLVASLRDQDLARGALGDAFARIGLAADQGEDLRAGEVLEAARGASTSVWLHLRKTGHADDHPLADLDDEVRDLLLLRGLGLGLDDLRRAGVVPKDATLEVARAALAAAADALVASLPLPAHEEAGEHARRIARAALDRGDELDLSSEELRAEVEAHTASCAPCAVLRERLLAASEVELRVCPLTDELLAEVRERVERDRVHRAAVASIAARISLACSFCHAPMVRSEATFCAACLAPHHEDCFRDHGRCSAAGCGEQAIVRPGREARPRRRLAVALGLTGLLGAAAFAGGELARRDTAASLVAARQLEAERAAARALDLETRLRFSQRTIDELAVRYETTKLELAKAKAGDRPDMAALDPQLLDYSLWAEVTAAIDAAGPTTADLAAPPGSPEERAVRDVARSFDELQRSARRRRHADVVTVQHQVRASLLGCAELPTLEQRVARWEAGLREVEAAMQRRSRLNQVTEGVQGLRALDLAAAARDARGAELAATEVQRIAEELRSTGSATLTRAADVLDARRRELLSSSDLRPR